MSILSAGTTTQSGLGWTADTTGNLILQTNNTGNAVIINTAQNVTMTNALSVTGNVTAANHVGNVVYPDASIQTAAASPYVLKNRIINGDFRIDQRNAGASIATTNISAEVYTLDRWHYRNLVASKYTIQQNAGSVTPPSGFTNYLGCTSTSAYTVATGDFFTVGQYIEGFNVSDLDFGKSTAKTITLSFWARSSLTGTFGGVVANQGFSRCYPFSYTISSANTWTQISITIAGDTSGTWLTTNGTGLSMRFSLGAGSDWTATAGAWTSSGVVSATGATSVVGTNGATFYITGVQLELGSTATPFERRLYNQELANCQRYYQKTYNQSVVPGTASRPGLIQTVVVGTGGTDYSQVNLFVSMRAGPTISIWDGAGNANAFSAYAGGAWTDNTTSSITSANTGEMSWSISYAGNPFSTGARYMFHFAATAEL
jgi:hypothetical protein